MSYPSVHTTAEWVEYPDWNDGNDAPLYPSEWEHDFYVTTHDGHVEIFSTLTTTWRFLMGWIHPNLYDTKFTPQSYYDEKRGVATWV